LNYPTNPIAALKHEDEQYVDGMSPPSSANESETLPSISLSTNPVAFQSKFPVVISDYEEHDDEGDQDFKEEDELEEEMPSRRSDIVSAFFSFFNSRELVLLLSRGVGCRPMTERFCFSSEIAV